MRTYFCPLLESYFEGRDAFDQHCSECSEDRSAHLVVLYERTEAELDFADAAIAQSKLLRDPHPPKQAVADASLRTYRAKQRAIALSED